MEVTKQEMLDILDGQKGKVAIAYKTYLIGGSIAVARVFAMYDSDIEMLNDICRVYGQYEVIS
jgi:hypothetical protein